MRSTKEAGRIIGVVLLVQLLVGPVVYLGLIQPASGAGFLTSAAPSALQVRWGVLLSFVAGLLTLAVAIVALPLVRRQSERMAFALLALSVAGLSTLALENVAIRSMLALSQEYAQTTSRDELFRTLGPLARSTSLSAHHTNLMLAHGTLCLFYGILFRFALVPRPLAAIGLVATLVSVTAVTLPLLGYHFVFQLVLPAGLTQLALTLWLIAKGFDEPEPRARGTRS